jgi:hypothetical protein
LLSSAAHPPELATNQAEKAPVSHVFDMTGAYAHLGGSASPSMALFLARERPIAYPETANMTRVATLVVIEFGAAWPKWLEPSRGGDLAVVAQHYEGEPKSLITQVANRVARLETTGWALGSTVLVANARTDADAFAARSVLARGLLARLAKAGGGDLVLTVEDSAGMRAIQALTGLCAAIDPDASKVNVRIGLRIGRHEPLYGTLSEQPSAP